MYKELIAPIRERISIGHTKEQIKNEALQFGYSETDFDSAYNEALLHEESTSPLIKTQDTTAMLSFFTPKIILILFASFVFFAIASYVSYTYLSKQDQVSLPQEAEMLTEVKPLTNTTQHTPQTEISPATATTSSQSNPQEPPAQQTPASPLDAVAQTVSQELEDANKRANTAIVKSEIVRTASDVLLCADLGTFTEPREDEFVCDPPPEVGWPAKWPVLSKYGAHWGGCPTKFYTADDFTFRYCAVLEDGTVVVCNEDRCDFTGVN